MTSKEEFETIYNKLKNKHDLGKNADYIPELAKVNPKLFAISVYTVDGQSINLGDYNDAVALESASKVFTLALALEKFGIPYLQEKIGQEKSNGAFNSIESVVNSKTHTLNSFDNAGAMATTSLHYKPNGDIKKVTKELYDNMSNFADRKLHINNKIYKSELSNDEHNLALAYLLKSYNRFYGDVMSCVDIYTRQCSVMVTSKDVALMAATLANGGVNPKSKKRLVKEKNVGYILHHMKLNGLYNQSELVMKYENNVVAKSGVGGVILIVVPGIMGIGIVAPPLNKYGNSYKGIEVMKMVMKYLNK